MVARVSESSRRCALTRAESHRVPNASAVLHYSAFTGDDAQRLLRAEAFRAEWRALHAACPWATAFQNTPFTDAWWDSYGDVFDPLLLTARDTSGALAGVFMLARERSSGRVTPVGAHHAEYHAWLATPTCGDAFMHGALAPLREELGVRHLRLHFLAPNAPLGWTAHARGPFAPLVLMATHRRGLRALDAGVRDTEALRRKSTRSKLARLRRAGDVSYATVTTLQEFERWLPQIMAQTDARHGTASSPGPFAGDPRKARFYRRLMQESALMHCGVLVRGDQLLASHTGWIDRGALGLGLITFDATEQEHSPGTLVLHMVAQDVATRGVETFDLTPGGAYKQRFATHEDVVHTLDLLLDSRRALRAGVTSTARKLAKRLLGRG